MSRIHTDAEAIELVRTALRRYGEQVEPTAAAARQEMAEILNEIAEYMKECAGNIARLQGRIEALREA